jgi:hypothetical protein
VIIPRPFFIQNCTPSSPGYARDKDNNGGNQNCPKGISEP